jgi:hypothetical protein
MGDGGADDPAGATWWAQTLGECARGLERDFLGRVGRLPVEGVAEGPATEEHSARISGAVELGRPSDDSHHAQATNRKRLLMNPNFWDGL